MNLKSILTVLGLLTAGLLPQLAQAQVWTPPRSVVRVPNVSYGAHERQRYDVYKPAAPVTGAPVIVMVHGGGWYQGDKRQPNTVANKVEYYVPKGFILISVNYRMLDDGAQPHIQKVDVASAISFAQTNAATYGGDPKKFVVMGHSAGGHLVSMVATTVLQTGATPRPYLGTVSLDAGGLDLVEVMTAPFVPEVFINAFGDDPQYWFSNSPYHQLGLYGAPTVSKTFLATCSTQRLNSCDQSHRFADKFDDFGGFRSAVVEMDFDHEQMNDLLGADPAYTNQVNAWLKTLDPAIAKLLP